MVSRTDASAINILLQGTGKYCFPSNVKKQHNTTIQNGKAQIGNNRVLQ